MIIGSRQRLSAQCDDVEIRIDDQIIKRVDHTKSLGLTIDAQLSWGKHVEEICKKVSSAIGALKRVRPFISKETAIQIYNALIMPHFDYWILNAASVKHFKRNIKKVADISDSHMAIMQSSCN